MKIEFAPDWHQMIKDANCITQEVVEEPEHRAFDYYYRHAESHISKRESAIHPCNRRQSVDFTRRRNEKTRHDEKHRGEKADDEHRPAHICFLYVALHCHNIVFCSLPIGTNRAAGYSYDKTPLPWNTNVPLAICPFVSVILA